MRRLNIVAALLLTLALLASTSGQAIASMLCSTEKCPKKAAKAIEQAQPKSCCPQPAKDSPDESKTDTCCCKIKAAPDMAVETIKAVAHVPILVHLAVPEPPATVEAVSIELADQIIHEADSSPPDSGIAPDLGRAPPAA